MKRENKIKSTVNDLDTWHKQGSGYAEEKILKTINKYNY